MRVGGIRRAGSERGEERYKPCVVFLCLSQKKSSQIFTNHQIFTKFSSIFHQFSFAISIIDNKIDKYKQ